MVNDEILKVENLKTYFYTKNGVVKAVDDIIFDIKKGEVIGLAGESGCGKSTTAYSIIRMIPRPGKLVGGRILFDGEDLAKKTLEEMRKIRWNDISIIFQGAMNALNPVFEIGYQIVEAILLHENTTTELAWDKTAKLFEMVGLDPDRVHQYPHEFSGGMRQRAMIAMALASDPQLVIADEPTTALDVTIQAQILQLIEKLQNDLNLSMMFISHDLGVIAEVTKRIAIMYAGHIMEFGPAVDVFKTPYHPYSAGLVGSVPSMEKIGRHILTSIPGSLPDLNNPPKGCPFHPRCEYRRDRCSQERPVYRELEKGHFTACHFSEELHETLKELIQ